LINRKIENGRHILNETQICKLIKTTFNIDIDIEYFEDKTFIEQINFFKTHNIIISSHGAQLVSIPFMKKKSLVIECCHEEYHPYYYFPGLSYTSNKYHVMVCDNHSVFPKWKSPEYEKNNNQLKLNINVNCNKLINIIKLYKINNNNLPERKCYLY
jgi:capsular polysaccharide biosynthesis protein